MWNSPPWLKKFAESEACQSRGRPVSILCLAGSVYKIWMERPNCLLEFQGLLLAVEEAFKRSCKRVWFETNSAYAIKVLNMECQQPWKARKMLLAIERTRALFESCKFSHIGRQGNRAAL